MNVSSSRRSSPAFNRRGRFAELDLDTTGFDFVAEDADIPGPPRLPEHEELLRLDTLHTLLRLRDLEHPVVAAMCEVLRSVFDAPLAGKLAIDVLKATCSVCTLREIRAEANPVPKLFVRESLRHTPFPFCCELDGEMEVEVEVMML